MLLLDPTSASTPQCVSTNLQWTQGNSQLTCSFLRHLTQLVVHSQPVVLDSLSDDQSPPQFSDSDTVPSNDQAPSQLLDSVDLSSSNQPLFLSCHCFNLSLS